MYSEALLLIIIAHLTVKVAVEESRVILLVQCNNWRNYLAP